ncbi:MAG: dienelactone hydrolase family protein [Candidatus Binatia bacterium]
METVASAIAIKAPDGQMSGHLVRPAAPRRYPAVLVIMEAFGLNDHIKGVAARVATQGYAALAPDVYYREKNNVVAYDQLPDAIRLMSRLADDKIAADISAAVQYLQSQDFVRADRIGIMGFCMGGRISFLSACRIPGIAASVPFYGGGIGALLGEASNIQCPMLLFFGGQDAYIPNDEVARIEKALSELGKRAEVKLYPDAPHGFFCDERDSYRADTARDAWKHLNAFLAEHLQS